MSLQIRSMYSALIGAGAGFFVWIVAAATGLLASAITVSHIAGAGPYPFWATLGLAVLMGSVLGTVLALLELRHPARRWRILSLGLGLGTAGAVACALAQALLYHTLPRGESSVPLGQFLVGVFATSFAWGLGMLPIGAAYGIASGARSVARQGAMGALAGGLIGGALLRIAQEAFDDDPAAAAITQMAALIAMGALTGFFAVFLPDRFKAAWIGVQTGKKSRDEYIIASAVTTIGSKDDCDIVLSGDTRIAPVHAVIEAISDSHRHRLRHAARNQPGAPERYPATRINGEILTSEKWLVDGDAILIAGVRISFRERATEDEGLHRSEALRQDQAERFGEERVYGLSPRQETGPAAAPYMPGPNSRRVPQPGAAAAPDRPKTSRRSGAYDQQAAVQASIPAGSSGSIGTRLVCSAGPYQGQAFPVTSGRTTIGRDMNSAIPLPADTSVSHRHATVVYENGRHTITDDGSTHGTVVNGAAIYEPHILHTGDLIAVGDTLLRYE